jgi:PAS domain S-box-containing protein
MRKNPTFTELEESVRSFEKAQLKQRKIIGELQILNSKYLDIVESISDVFFAMDKYLKYTYWNKACEMLTGIPAEKAIGKSPMDILPDNQARSRIISVFLQVVERKKSKRVVEQFPGDEQIFHEISVYPTLEGVVVFIKDISEHKRLEQERSANLLFFENMDKINRVIQQSSDLDQMMRDVLDEVLRIYGCDRAWLLYPCDPQAAACEIPMERTTTDYPGGKALMQKLPVVPDVAQRFKIMLASNEPVGFGPGNERSLPSTVPMDTRSQLSMAIYPKIDSPYAFGIHQCSGERPWSLEERKLFKEIGRRMEDSLNTLLMYYNLRNSEERFRAVFEQAAVGIARVGPEGEWLEVNQKLCDIIGYSRKQLIGKTFQDLTHPEDLDADLAFVNQMLGDEIQMYEMEKRYLRENGSVVWINLTVGCVRNPDRSINYFISVVEDISEQKRVEKERGKLQEELLQAQKMEAIGTLAGGIAHDFNNILSIIHGYTELSIKAAESGSRQESNLHEVLAASKRAKELVWQILTYARKTDEETHPIRLDVIVKEALKFLRSSIPTTISIEQRIQSDALTMGNSTQAHQIIMNLCTNAAHAMDQLGGTLTVGLGDTAIRKTSTLAQQGLKPGKYLELVVADTGPGIPPDIIDSIFEPYFTTKGAGKGTGLGLSVVQGIVEKNGGKIFVDTRPKEGTAFRVFLPIIRRQPLRAVVAPEELPSGTERILIVDDEAPLVKMEKQALEDLGYAVTTQTSSIKALELFRANPREFDLVITDMTMPNMTGDVLATELMTVRPDIPVILCTGYSKIVNEETAHEIGIKAFVYKPVLTDKLAKTVRNVLDDAKTQGSGH